jgi:hypothetical protein
VQCTPVAFLTLILRILHLPGICEPFLVEMMSKKEIRFSRLMMLRALDVSQNVPSRLQICFNINRCDHRRSEPGTLDVMSAYKALQKTSEERQDACGAFLLNGELGR